MEGESKGSPSDLVTIYTDGACKGNPGPGGWGAVILKGDKRKELRGGEPATTNNRMELMAAIKALRFLPAPRLVELHTDSTYLTKGITSWIGGWKRKGWKASDGAPVKNRDLWEELDRLNSVHQVTWRWVRGHAGHAENERADALANRAISEMGTK